MKTRSTIVSMTAIVAVASVIAGCSSPDSGSSSGNAGATEGPAYEAVVEHSATPTDAGIAGPLSAKPPTGQKIDFLACALPVCEQQSNYFREAADKLGWTTNVISFKQTPEALQAAFDTAIADKPNGVVVSGFPVAAYADQLAELDKLGIPVVDYATVNPVGDGLIAVVGGDTADKYGAYQAEWIAADAGDDAHVVMFNTPDFPAQIKLQDALRTRLKELCPDCTLDIVDVALSDIGPGLPNKIVSQLQRTPDANYLVLGFADLGAGVPAALKNAGLDVKITTAAPQQSTFQEVMDGNVAMVAAQAQEEQQWCIADALARHSVGDEVPPNGCDLPSQILTAENVTEAWAIWPGVPGWKDQFAKIWQTA